jgi:hypothetical protein
VFAGIKRLLGIDDLYDNNEVMMNGKTPRSEWEREDGTVNKEKQAEALNELKLQREARQNSQRKNMKC